MIHPLASCIHSMSTWDHLFLVHFPSLAASLIVQSSYNHTLKVSDSKSSLFVAWTYVLNPHVLALTDLKVLINVIIICSSTLVILIFYHKILKCSTPKSWCLSSTSPQHPAFGTSPLVALAFRGAVVANMALVEARLPALLSSAEAPVSFPYEIGWKATRQEGYE